MWLPWSAGCCAETQSGMTKKANVLDENKPIENAPLHLSVLFEEEFTAGLKDLFEEKIVFNKTLGIKITSITQLRVTASMAMRPELIGHYAHNRIHGGAISAGLASALSAVALISFTNAGGSLAGPNSPYQVTDSKPGRPASA